MTKPTASKLPFRSRRKEAFSKFQNAIYPRFSLVISLIENDGLILRNYFRVIFARQPPRCKFNSRVSTVPIQENISCIFTDLVAKAPVVLS